MNTFRKFLFAVAALSAVCEPAAAELQLVIAETPDHQITLENRPSSIQTEVTGIDGRTPFNDVLVCQTLTERLLPAATSQHPAMEAILAQYNLVNLWLGNICPGTAITGFTPEQARDWLIELAGLHDSEDGSPFLRSRNMLAEFYLFGAPGFQPDYEAAKLALEAHGVQRPGLYLAYMKAHGLGGEADLAASIALLERASAAGDRTATTLLAQATEIGDGRPRDEVSAFRIYRELAAAISPPVWYRLGLMYREGRGVAADPCQARIWLGRAARHAWSPVPAAWTALAQMESPQNCPN